MFNFQLCTVNRICVFYNESLGQRERFSIVGGACGTERAFQVEGRCRVASLVYYISIRNSDKALLTLFK